MPGTGFGAGLGASLAGGTRALPANLGGGQDKASSMLDAQANMVRAEGENIKSKAESAAIIKEIQTGSETGIYLSSLMKKVMLPDEQGGINPAPQFVDPKNKSQLDIGALTTVMLQTAAEMKLSGPAYEKALSLVREQFKIAPDIISLWAKTGMEQIKKASLESAKASVDTYKQESKADPALKALTGVGAYTSVAEGKSFDVTTGSMEGAKLKADASAAGGNIKVEMPGAPTSGFQTDSQKNIRDAMNTMYLTSNLLDTYKTSYSTYFGQGKKAVSEILEKAGVEMGEGAKAHVEGMSQWVQTATQVELAYRRFISGVAVRPEEIPAIQTASIDPAGDSPTEIQAKLKNMHKNLKVLSAREWVMVLRGTPPTPEVLAALPLDDPYLVTVADTLDKMFKEKPALRGVARGDGLPPTENVKTDWRDFVGIK